MMVFAGCAGCAGCNGCTSKAEKERQRLEAERLAAEEAARLEAERLAAEEAARLEAERLAAEEAARLEAERLAAEEAARLEAERLAALARQRGQQQAPAAQPAQPAADKEHQSVAPADPAHPFAGTWVNSSETIVLDIRADGNITVRKYVLTDEYVEMYWREMRGIRGGGFYDTRNPVDFESTYTGSGTMTLNNNNIVMTLSLKNDRGDERELGCNGTYTFDAQKANFRLSKGLARKVILREDTRKQIDSKDYVFQFFRTR
ncbi:MAG: hypothetical protein LBQ55_09405 [Treponema sp.]|nr:hypothetical protein [Treponema sp.]